MWAKGTFTLILVRETERRSVRNKEAFSSFSMSQDRLSLFLFLSSCLHRLSLFLFLSPYIHRLSPQSPLRAFSVHHSAKVLGLQNRFFKLFDFVASLSLLLSPCTHRLSLCFYLGVRLGLTGYLFYYFMGKLHNWSLSFTSYFNLVYNFSIVTIWSLTF